MPTYITLLSYTDQGIRNVRDTTQRARAFRETAGKAGVTVRDIFWTLGEYDLVTILDAPDDQVAMGLLLSVGSMGNVRTKTLRGFSAEEVEKVLSRVGKA